MSTVSFTGAIVDGCDGLENAGRKVLADLPGVHHDGSHAGGHGARRRVRQRVQRRRGRERNDEQNFRAQRRTRDAVWHEFCAKHVDESRSDAQESGAANNRDETRVRVV